MLSTRVQTLVQSMNLPWINRLEHLGEEAYYFRVVGGGEGKLIESIAHEGQILWVFQAIQPKPHG